MNNIPRKKKAKTQTAKIKDAGMRELLDLLKTHPHLVRALIFDHAKVKRLLKSKTARRLIPGVDARTAPTTTLYVEGDNGLPYTHYQILRCLKRSA